MLVIAILITGFAFTYALKDGFEQLTMQSLNSGFITQYKCTTGDFDDFNTDDFDKFDLSLFLLLTFAMPLLLLNLLVAILSDAHKNVIDSLEETENAQTNSIILELETYMFWNRDKSNPRHLIFAEYDQITDPNTQNSHHEILANKLDDMTDRLKEFQDQQNAHFVKMVYEKVNSENQKVKEQLEIFHKDA
jgi:hypothetical protein